MLWVLLLRELDLSFEVVLLFGARDYTIEYLFSFWVFDTVLSSFNVNESMLPGSDLVLDSVIPCIDPSSESLDANSKVFGSFSDFDIIGFVSRHCMSLFLGRMIYFNRCILCIHFREDLSS